MTQIAMIFGAVGVLIGMLIVLLLEGKMLRHARHRGYRHAVQDILRDHLYKDTDGHWHQIEITWRDISPKTFN